MKKNLAIIYWVAVVAMLSACEGEQGDPGPQGERGLQGEAGPSGESVDSLSSEPSGFIKGTLSGYRQDGTPFTETFHYKYKSENEGFTESNKPGLSLCIKRNKRCYLQEGSQALMKFQVLDLEGTPHFLFDDHDVHFSYTEKLSSNLLFAFEGTLICKETSVNFPMSKDDTVYNFQKGAKYYSYHREGGNSYLDFKLKDGSLVRYEESSKNYDPDKRVRYGNFVSLIKLDGSVVKDRVIYEGIRLQYNPGKGIAFYKNGQDLSETVIIPKDEIEITNFNYGKGVVSYDYRIKLYGGRDYGNSSNNDVTIVGSVEAEVFDRIVSRMK